MLKKIYSLVMSLIGGNIETRDQVRTAWEKRREEQGVASAGIKFLIKSH